ncbi:MAG TPA: class I SAM-dependent methyltransferase [Candidatus Limnocylindrales bacterium]|nr:class I SAM-dependent methyltransferase [Candidatus Limnocylindrales bacterium]
MTTAQRNANAEQIQYWNEVGGPKWVRFQQMLDSQLEGLGMAALEAASITGSENVLDVGCGCGSTTLMLARELVNGGRAVGIDISRPMLELARQRAQQEKLHNVTFEEADAQTFRFPEEEFEILFSRFGVMFFEDPVKAFENMRTALRPGGHVAFVCWQAPDRNPWMSVPVMIGMKHIPLEMSAGPDAPGPFAFADADRVHRILRNAGFSGISVEAYNRDLTIGGGGDVDQAVQFVMELGPFSRAMVDVPEAKKREIADEIAQALKSFEGPRGVRMPAAAWIVTAEN